MVLSDTLSNMMLSDTLSDLDKLNYGEYSK